MDSNANQLATIDFDKAYIIAQQPHENGFRASPIPEFTQWLNVRLDLQGAELIDPTSPGTELAPSVIPPGPEDRKGKFEPEPGFYDGFPEVTSERRWYFYWDMNSWSLKDMGALPENIKSGSVSELDNYTSSEARVVESGSGNKYVLETVVQNNISRQYRISPNVGGIPYLSWRDYSNGSWSGNKRGLLLEAFNDNYDLLTKSGAYYRDTISEQPRLMLVNSEGSVTSQLIIFPRLDGSVGLSSRSSQDGGETWSAFRDWTEQIGTISAVVSSANLDSTITGGVFRVTQSSGNNFIVNVAVSGQQIRQTRVEPNLSGIPQIVYRDSVNGGSTWSSWTSDTRGMLSGEVASGQINNISAGGLYRILVGSGNDYELLSTVSGSTRRQSRVDNSISSEHPNLVFRDYRNGSWGDWKVRKEPIDVTSSTEDIMWSWWIYPAVLRSSSIFNKIYASYTDSAGNTGVLSKNLDNGDTARTNVKHENLEIDDHNAGAVIRLEDGTLLTGIPSGHSLTNRFYIYKSVGKENNVKWRHVTTLLTGGNSAYSQILQIGGAIYILCRTQSSTFGWRWRMTKSLDNGETWTEFQTVIRSNFDTQWYGIFRPVSDNDDLIRFCHYSNPTLNNSQIRGGFIKISTSEVLDNDAITVRGLVGQENEATAFDTIIPLQSERRNRLFDLQITEQADWQILFCRFSDAFDGEYYHYDNGTERFICSGGRTFNGSSYYGGAVFGSEGKIYTSRWFNSSWLIEENTLSENVYSVTDEVYNSGGTSKVAIRPVYTYGIITWLSGYFNQSDFKDFLTEMKYKYVG